MKGAEIKGNQLLPGRQKINHKRYGMLGSNVKYWWFVLNRPKHAKNHHYYSLKLWFSPGLEYQLYSSLFPLSFSLFLSLTNQGKHKMALLREQLVMSVCKIETGKVSPPARLPSDCSYQSYWASITFSCICRLHHQQGDEALGDIFLCLGLGTIARVPFGSTHSRPDR